MKDVLKIMRFDYLTAKPIAFGGMLFAVLLFGSLGLFFSPMICSYISFIAVILVVPLQKTADNPQRGCFSASGRTQKRDKLLIANI